MSRCVRVASIACVLASLAPAPVRAYRPCEFAVDGAPSCEDLLSCSGPAACPAGWECSAYDGDMPSVTLCRPPCGTLFACGDSMDCPRLGDAAGECVGVEGMSTRFCVYETRTPKIDYCRAAGDASISARSFDACHTPPGGGTPSVRYAYGDCDDDTCPNGADPLPCSSGMGAPCDVVPSCPLVVADGGVMGPDGGSRDAAPAPREDAGPEPRPDAGPRDAGDPEVGRDAGGFDAEPPGPERGLHFSGGGGCAASGSSPGEPTGLALLALLLAARRRRR